MADGPRNGRSVLQQVLIVDSPLQGVPELLFDRVLQFPEPTPHLEDHLFGDHRPDPELIVPGQPQQMRDRLTAAVVTTIYVKSVARVPFYDS
jgi:hypothetical protein